MIFFFYFFLFFIFFHRFVLIDNTVLHLRNLSMEKHDTLVYTSDLTIKYFNLLNNYTNRISYTRDIARPLTPVFHFRKNSILTYMFDRKMEIFKESGLIAHWIERYKRKCKKNKHRTPTKLGIPNILAIVEISAFMYLIAFVVFLIEILCNQYERTRECLEYLTY